MRMCMRLLTAALLAALVLTAMAMPAAAARSLSIEGETTVTLNGTVTFRGGGFEFACSVTLVRTMSRIIPKIIGTLKGRVIGFIVPLPRCRSSGGGTLTALELLELERGEALAWRLYYRGFTGTLPNILRIRLRIQRVRIRPTITILGIATACLYEGEIENEDVLNAEGLLTETRVELSILTLVEGGGLCPRTIEVSGALRAASVVRFRLL